jgi:MFS transporter, OPA family, glycerol-3-phosphate transporter
MEKKQAECVERLGYSEPDYKKYIKFAWLTLLGFSILYLFMYNGRLNMGLALPSLFKEFGWTKAEAGILTSMLFWTYGIGQLINGRLSEIVGQKKFILMGAILSIITNIVVSFQTSFLVIAILWALNGYFQGMVFAPGLSLISKWFPSKRRGLATGIASASAATAQLVVWLCVLGSMQIMPDWGWRAAFRLPVLLTAVVVIVFWFLAKNDQAAIGLPAYQEEIPEVKDAEEKYERLTRERGKFYPYKILFSHWTFIVWCIVCILLSAGRYAMLTWIPTFFMDVYNVNVKQTLTFSIGLPLGMILGAFVVPYLSDKFFARHRAVGICGVTIGSFIMCLILPRLGSAEATGYALFVLGFFDAAGALMWTMASDVGTRVLTGTAIGTLNFFMYMGAALQSIVLGKVLHITKDWTMIFAILAGVYILSTVLSALGAYGAESAKKARANIC